MNLQTNTAGFIETDRRQGLSSKADLSETANPEDRKLARL